MDIGTSLQQMAALNEIDFWYKDKDANPFYFLAGPAGCKSGSTIIHYRRGIRNSSRPITLENFVKRFNGIDKRYPWNKNIDTYVQSIDQTTGNIFYNKVNNAWYTGKKTCLRITTDVAGTVEITLDDKLLLNTGKFKKVADIQIGDVLLCKGSMECISTNSKKKYEKHKKRKVIYGLKHYTGGTIKNVECNGKIYTYKREYRSRLVYEAFLNGISYDEYVFALKNTYNHNYIKTIPPKTHIHHINDDCTDDRLENLHALSIEEHGKLHGNENISNFNRQCTKIARVVKIENIGEIDVYDLTMQLPWDNFVVNEGIITHNTGKTFLAKNIAKGKKVAYCAYTGKAVNVMKKSGCFGASTIHSLVYKTIVHEDGRLQFIFNRDSIAATADLIIVDECSMVDESLATDLLSYKTKILVLGDKQQLPPVNGEGYFTNGDPDFELTDIHRQALDNPILLLATAAIQGETLDYGTYGTSKVVRSVSDKELLDADVIIVGKNATRKNLNEKIRKLKGYTGLFPNVGEKIICLKNDKNVGAYNGQTFVVRQVLKSKRPEFLLLKVEDVDTGKVLFSEVHKCFFDKTIKEPFWTKLQGSQQYDFAYAVTCHKCQGDQYNNVVIIDESYISREFKNNWLYTAITRAVENVTIVRS